MLQNNDLQKWDSEHTLKSVKCKAWSSVVFENKKGSQQKYHYAEYVWCYCGNGGKKQYQFPPPAHLIRKSIRLFGWANKQQFNKKHSMVLKNPQSTQFTQNIYISLVQGRQHIILWETAFD